MTSLSAPLTAKGRATRDRIADAAAELFYEHGVAATSNTDIRAAAGVSGSQLTHYFPDRTALVEAVLERRLADAVEVDRFPGSGMPHSLAGLQRWRDIYIERYAHLYGGCKVGSLASEVAKSPIDLHEQVAAGYRQWHQALADGVRRMVAAGELASDADPDRLGMVLLTALQGGLLLTGLMRSVEPLATALDGAIELVRQHRA